MYTLLQELQHGAQPLQPGPQAVLAPALALTAPLCSSVDIRRSCVMVPDPNLDRKLCGGADQLLDSLEQFRPEQWGLPPFPADGS